MSENLNLVRSIFADWERGDFSHGEWADAQIGFIFADGPTPGRWHGIPGGAEVIHTIFKDFEDYRVEAEEYRELDRERVLVLTRAVGRGKLSGAPVSNRSAEVFEIHNGKVTSVVVYTHRDRALADLGLEA
jgi:ketosteroid isomerase-like protein